MLENIVKFFKTKYGEKKKKKESNFLTKFIRDMFHAKRFYVIKDNIPTNNKPYRNIFVHHAFHKDDTILELNLVFKDLNIALAHRYDAVNIDIDFIASDFIYIIRDTMEQYYKEYDTKYPDLVKQKYICSLENEVTIITQTIKHWRAQKKLEDYKEQLKQCEMSLRESIEIELDG